MTQGRLRGLFILYVCSRSVNALEFEQEFCKTNTYTLVRQNWTAKTDQLGYTRMLRDVIIMFLVGRFVRLFLLPIRRVR